MNNIKRIFLFVLDSFGIGASADAKSFGDSGCSTIKSIASSDEFNIPNLLSLGFSGIDGLSFLGNGTGKATVARLTEKSKGKDTTIGHWEIAGVISENPLPTFPNGFPEDFLEEFSALTGRGILCNKAYSGTEVIKDFGNEHLKTGKLIVYTSADSVFQIAAHESIVSPEELYEYCKIARRLLTGELGVGRVIARPFEGDYPFKRTSRRHDFSISPPEETILDYLESNGFDTIAVGKIFDIFNGEGITEHKFTSGNSQGMEIASEYQNKDFNGLCFINLVDFDMIYGHRRDCNGYAKAISEFDSRLGDFIENLKDDDALIITADHGCDPAFKGTDHTREDVPFILFGKNISPEKLGTIEGFDFVSQVIKKLLVKE